MLEEKDKWIILDWYILAKGNKRVLSEKIVQLAQGHGRISIAFISTALEANRNTVKKHVRQLAENGRLVRHGKGRGTYYSPYWI